jgi:hypothetical protein
MARWVAHRSVENMVIVVVVVTIAVVVKVMIASGNCGRA